MAFRALITGVSGFAGCHLAEHLLQCGDAVLGCSPKGQWEPSSPQELADRVELVPWDLGDATSISPQALQRIEQFRPEGIYHLAAMSVPKDCGDNEPSAAALAVNVEGTRRVLQLAGSLPSRPRVLLISSSHVYAPVSAASPRVDETAPLGPQWGYGRTKLLAEAEARRAIEQDGCDAVIARSFQHTGPRQLPPMMLAAWARQFVAADTGPVEVHTRDAYIDLTDVRDVVRAYRLLLEHGRTGEIYNIGSGKSCRSGDVLEILQQMAGPRRIVELHPGRKQDPIADISRLVGTTGWCAKIPLEKTVADTLAWWRQFQ